MRILKLHHLKPAPGSRTKATRVGRGIAAGQGKTAGRGTKGQKARNRIPPGFEGGQTPMKLRVPKFTGFRNRARVEYHVVNVAVLERRFEPGETVTADALRQRGLIRKAKKPVKVLAQGELTKALTVRVDALSTAAAEKIRAAGGTTS
jgi:large subunit ribosomal protein L15